MDDERREGVRLEDYLRVLRDRAWVIVASVVIVVVVALFTSLNTTPLYSASAELVYDKSSMNTAVFGYEIFGYDYDRQRTIETAIAAVGRNESIAEGVQTQLAEAGLPGADLSPEDLSGLVGASSVTDSDLVTITAVSTDPAEAAAVANAFADQFIIYRQNEARKLVAEARDLLKSELDSMTPEERASGTGQVKQDKYEDLRILEAMQDGDFKVLRLAPEPIAAFTPQTRRNIILAVVLGLVLGVGLAFLLEYLDKRIKDERTLERLMGAPVLAAVPVLGRGWRKINGNERSLDVIGFAGDRSALLESYRTLRSTLQYFNVDGNLRKILVTSGLPLEGKTVTTVNLGISLAMSGKRVIILEADLRRPMVHEYLGLNNDTGLSNVLAGNSTVPNALQLVPMDPFLPSRARRGENGRSPLLLRKNLYCLPSGPLPPNPSELLQSTRMADIIDELEGLCDYLLIDTPPVLPVSDAVTLAPGVDAVIIAARLHATTRGEAEEVREVLSRAGAHVIGVVAGGVKVKKSHYYRRGYHYSYGGREY